MRIRGKAAGLLVAVVAALGISIATADTSMAATSGTTHNATVTVSPVAPDGSASSRVAVHDGSTRAQDTITVVPGDGRGAVPDHEELDLVCLREDHGLLDAAAAVVLAPGRVGGARAQRVGCRAGPL